MLLPLDYNGFYQIFFSFIRKTSQNFCKKAWKSLLLCSQMDSNLTLNFSVLHKPLVVPWLWGFFVHTATKGGTGQEWNLGYDTTNLTIISVSLRSVLPWGEILHLPVALGSYSFRIIEFIELIPAPIPDNLTNSCSTRRGN